jgi:hypothetical protein
MRMARGKGEQAQHCPGEAGTHIDAPWRKSRMLLPGQNEERNALRSLKISSSASEPDNCPRPAARRR